MSVTTRSIEWPAQTLESVMTLHRADSRRLGFFPRGAFEDHARVGQILLALNDQDQVLGYLLFRVAKQRAMIVHLCTAPSSRGKGVGRQLIQHALDYFRSEGLACAVIETMEGNEAGKHLYPSCGFVEITRQIQYAMKL